MTAERGRYTHRQHQAFQRPAVICCQCGGVNDRTEGLSRTCDDRGQGSAHATAVVTARRAPGCQVSARSGGPHEPSKQEVELAPAIHLALDQLEPVHLTFGLAL
jgi:hypothetical protein